MIKNKCLDRLRAIIEQICPILGGISWGRFPDKSTLRIGFAENEMINVADLSVTNPVHQLILNAIDTFDSSNTAQAAWEEDQKPERKTLRQQAANAINEIDAFLAIPSPTAAQVRDEVRRVCQRQKAIIRRLIQID